VVRKKLDCRYHLLCGLLDDGFRRHISCKISSYPSCTVDRIGYWIGRLARTWLWSWSRQSSLILEQTHWRVPHRFQHRMVESQAQYTSLLPESPWNRCGHSQWAHHSSLVPRREQGCLVPQISAYLLPLRIFITSLLMETPKHSVHSWITEQKRDLHDWNRVHLVLQSTTFCSHLFHLPFWVPHSHYCNLQSSDRDHDREGCAILFRDRQLWVHKRCPLWWPLHWVSLRRNVVPARAPSLPYDAKVLLPKAETPGQVVCRGKWPSLQGEQRRRDHDHELWDSEEVLWREGTSRRKYVQEEFNLICAVLCII